MRLTGRGRAVLVLGVLALAVGFWGGYPFLRALGGALVGAVLAAVLLTARGLTVTVRRSVYPDRVERGRPAVATLRVGNPGVRRQAGFLATDPVAGTSRGVRVRSLPPGGEAVHHYELPTGTRGPLTVGPLTLHRVDPFGLSRTGAGVGETALLRVHPRQLPARPLAGGHRRHHHEGVRTDNTLRGSVDLQDVREYVPGDEVRHLHWKATARTGRLMVRDLADPAQPRLTVLLDDRAGGLTAADFEEAVDVTASLLGAAARAGHHTRLLTSTGRDLATPGGAGAVRQLLDELCELRQGPDASADGDVLPVAAGSRGGGALVVVTSAGTGLGPLARLRYRHPTIVVVGLAGADTVPDPLAGPAVPAADPAATPADPAAGRAMTSPGLRMLVAADASDAVRRWNEMVR
ncbi:DUF58 domain-containing protein [Plantactinospora sonchi]|uniref:DUF58 domain-containing protein n=1 Tax=Plantactinospora sonchi TaxID=1544735 RepID=A0ABU7RNY2_9ACTN